MVRGTAVCSSIAVTADVSVRTFFAVLCLFLVFIVIASRGEKNKRTIMHFLSEGKFFMSTILLLLHHG